MKGINTKYLLRITTLIPALVVALLFALFYNGLFNKDLNQHVSHQGRAYIRHLLPAAQLALLRHDDQIIQNLINTSIMSPDIKSLAFYNANGQMIAYRGGKHSLKHSFTPPHFTGNYIETKQLNPSTLNFIAPITIPKFNLYAHILFKNSLRRDILGWVSIDLNTKPIIRKRNQMLVATAFITLFSLFMGFIFHYFLAKRIYLPVTRLRRSMKQILNNEFETEIIVSNPGEFGIIEKGCAHLQKKYLCTIQSMNQQIETATEDLQQALLLLEEKNIELTLDKKRTEEQSRQKSEFIADMSHEIRTPMNGVIGFTNVLLESKLDSLQLDYVKTIKSSAQDLLCILNDILDFSKINAGKLLLDCIPMDIRHCIDEVLALAGPNAQKKEVSLISITEVNVPKTVLGDPIRIKQILSNLITNAVKFTDRGHVLIRAKIEQESDKDYCLSLTVSDTGIGISPDAQHKLFTAFNQADTSITRRFGGFGLGLVICKKLCEQMQGRISFSSKVNQGSTFTALIHLSKLQAYEIEKNQSHPFSHLKALCYDDNPLYLESLCKHLNFWGIECVTVFSFQKLEQALVNHQDCNLAFIHLEKGQEQTISELISKTNHLSYVFVSKTPLTDSSHLSTHAFLHKPICIQKLESIITSVNNGKDIEKSIHHELNGLREEMRSLNLELLIADDNPVNKLLLNSLLGIHSNVTVVDDGEMAVSASEQKKFNIIILDLKMPKMDGLEAASMIRKQSSLNQETPILLISADSFNLSAIDIEQSGVDFCLQKPIDEKLLLMQILRTADISPPLAIDWQMCLSKVSGNASLAEEFLATFIEELHKNREEFLLLSKDNDLEGLADVAHKLKGACCFCGVPLLQKKVAQFEKCALNKTNAETLSASLAELIKEIDAVSKVYTHRMNKKIKEKECL